jgi:hypothetical protein
MLLGEDTGMDYGYRRRQALVCYFVTILFCCSLELYGVAAIFAYIGSYLPFPGERLDTTISQELYFMEMEQELAADDEPFNTGLAE